MTTITATYSPDDNKIRLYASTRLPRELYDRIRAAGYAWAPKQDLFVAPAWTPDREDIALELAGEIGDEDTSLAERAEQRAERFEAYSDKRAADGERARRGVAAIADNIPLGQPILIGHHSERHARRDAERIENGMRKAAKLWETSAYWISRARGAVAAAKYKERPDVRARRIKTIEADKRKRERQLDEAQRVLAFWSDPGLTLPLALRAAGAGMYGGARMPRKEGDREDFNQSPSVYDALAGSFPSLYAPRTLEECVAVIVELMPRRIAYVQRWIEHYDNRLAYEKAMLEDSGYIAPPKAPTRAVLPLLNYGGLVEYRDRYNRGKTITSEAHPMTKAEYAAIGSDYKGTFIGADGLHRVRCAIVGNGPRRGLCVVYLTDSKIHPKPGAGPIEGADAELVAARQRKAQETIEAGTAARAAVNAHNKAVIDAHRAELPPRTPEQVAIAETARQLREAARAGVQVVTAPQLFPTPAALAARMVELADIQPGDAVLEPSAGTGALLGAMGGRMFGHNPERGSVHAVEINGPLASRLRAEFPLTRVHTGDFLEWNTGPAPALLFDRILMNPPFQNAVDIEHIEHAARMLKPGGRLVAICAGGPRQASRLQDLAYSNGGTWEPLPAGTFAEAGTGVNTVLLVIEGAPVECRAAA